jgi:hypothetical protein
MSIHIIGKITNSILTDDPEVFIIETLDGYHVASTEQIEGWESFETTYDQVDPESGETIKKSPPMQFYGVETFYYKFNDEQHYKDVAGIVDELDGEVSYE